MPGRYQYILLSGIALLVAFRVTGQNAMPDSVCTGQTSHYYVDPHAGSTFTWWINGVVQAGFTSNEFDHTWNTADIYLLEVQELSAEGCLGPPQSGQVFVIPQVQCTKDLPDNKISLIIPNAISPNGDLINDVWNIGNIAQYPKAIITVYNRWGKAVWRSGQGYPVPWDGKASSGKDLPVDSYHYYIDLHNGSRPFIGTITIVR